MRVRRRRKPPPAGSVSMPWRTAARMARGIAASYGAAQAAVEQRHAIAVVAGERLVAAFAGEHDLHALGGEPRHEVERNARRVRDRLVLVPHEPRQRAEEIARR